MSPIRVLVVDDSAQMRVLLSEILSSDPAIEVVGSAMDAYAAREKIKKLNPDVLTLDVEMPKMNGLQFLKNLMRLRPMPVVMLSTLTEKGAEVTMRALELGAVEFVGKPKVDLNNSLETCAAEIIRKVKAAAVAKVRSPERNDSQNRRVPGPKLQVIAPVKATGDRLISEEIIAIGASTGGTEAIKEVLIRMHTDCPGIVITQHIPPVFSEHFARRMNETTSLHVCEASNGEKIYRGHAYIAPGDQHLTIARDGSGYRCQLSDDAPVNRHKPAVDVLFNSVAKKAGKNAVGVILTGMGRDGAKGLRAMQEAGAATVVQNEATSVVWGMPGAAVELEAADKIMPLANIAATITRLAEA